MDDIKMVDYPQYRKYHNGKSYFKIISPAAFEEIRLEGKKFVKHSFIARVLPDRNFIYDLTFDYEKYCEKIEEGEFLGISERIG